MSYLILLLLFCNLVTVKQLQIWTSYWRNPNTNVLLCCPALDLDFCANMEDGNYANPGLTLEADPRCTYVTCSSGRAYIFNCPLGTYNGKDYKHHFPLWGSDVTTFARAYHFRYGKKEVCRAEDKDAVCSR